MYVSFEIAKRRQMSKEEGGGGEGEEWVENEKPKPTEINADNREIFVCKLCHYIMIYRSNIEQRDIIST